MGYVLLVMGRFQGHLGAGSSQGRQQLMQIDKHQYVLRMIERDITAISDGGFKC
jgi:hypothetical protein